MLTLSRLLSEQCGIAIAHLFQGTAWKATSWDEVSSSTGLREFLTKQLIKCEGEMPVGQEWAWPWFEREQLTKDKGPMTPWDAILHRHYFTSWEFRDILICVSFSFFLFRSLHSFLAFFFSSTACLPALKYQPTLSNNYPIASHWGMMVKDADQLFLRDHQAWLAQ